MLFKDLKVGDTIYVNNPKQWDKPIKKTIGKILSSGSNWLIFYAENGDFIGDAILDFSQCISSGSGIFADFETYKKYWIDYHKSYVDHFECEKKKVCMVLEKSYQDLAIANELQEEA